METVQIERQDSAALVRLQRPQVRNAFNPTMVRELTEAFRGLGADVHVAVLSGAGKAFCAGADLAWMKESANYTRAQNLDDARQLAELFETVDTSPRIVLGKVNGLALGGGMGLIACCDIVVAAEDAQFGFTEVRLGLVPAVISPYVVAKIGVSAARRYFVSGEIFSAAQARRMGLVHEVAPAAQLDAVVDALIARVTANGPNAVAEAKALVRQVAHREPPAVREETAQLLARLRVSAEAQEGLAAFLQKREPKWP